MTFSQVDSITMHFEHGLCFEAWTDALNNGINFHSQDGCAYIIMVNLAQSVGRRGAKNHDFFKIKSCFFVFFGFIVFFGFLVFWFFVF